MDTIIQSYSSNQMRTSQNIQKFQMMQKILAQMMKTILSQMMEKVLVQMIKKILAQMVTK